VTLGDDVLVTGPGPVGLLAAQVARALGGAVLVTGLERDADRLAAARGLGFETETRSEALDARFAKRLGADVVIECSGSAGGATTCFTSLRRGGQYVQIGVFGKPVDVPLDRVFQTESVLTSGFASTPRSWRHALRLISDRSIQLEPLISDVVPLKSWNTAFAQLRRGDGIKIVFDPRMRDESDNARAQNAETQSLRGTSAARTPDLNKGVIAR
jgi:L-iditol 2-dehydrogenase